MEASWRLQLSSRGASSWIKTVAKRGQQPLDRQGLVDALRGRAGLHFVSTGRTCECGEQNIARAHYLACRSSLRQARHDVLGEKLERAMKATGSTSTQVEVNCIGAHGHGRLDLWCVVDGKSMALDISIVHADLCTRAPGWETRLVQVSKDISVDCVGHALGGFVRDACPTPIADEQAARPAPPINALVRGGVDSPSFAVGSGTASHTDPLGVRTSMERMAASKLRKYGEEVTIFPRGQASRRAKVVPFVLTAGGTLHEQACEVVNQVAYSSRSRERCAVKGMQVSDARNLLLAVIGRVVAIGSMLIMRDRMSDED